MSIYGEKCDMIEMLSLFKDKIPNYVFDVQENKISLEEARYYIDETQRLLQQVSQPIEKSRGYYNLGFYYEKSGRWKTAYKHYMSSTHYWEKHLNAWLNLGLILMRCKIFEPAQKVFEKILTIKDGFTLLNGDEYGLAHANLGRILLFHAPDRESKREEALKHLVLAVRKNSSDPETRELLSLFKLNIAIEMIDEDTDPSMIKILS